MIEVLIALLVLSFGLLGMAGLQATALQNNREARLQSAGVNLAREFAEMLRGNKDVAVLAPSSNPYFGDFSTSPLRPATTSSCLSIDSSCTTSLDVAKAEITEWLARVDASLPGARVKICRDSSPYTSAGLPQWDCTTGTGNDVIVIKIGWSRLSTNAAASDRNVKASSTDGRPGVVLPVTPGSTTP